VGVGIGGGKKKKVNTKCDATGSALDTQTPTLNSLLFAKKKTPQ
jgi:hypothetical protein